MLAVVASFISYKKRLKKCLPERGCSTQNVSGPIRRRGDISGPSLMYDVDDEMVRRTPPYPAMLLYDPQQHLHHHVHNPHRPSKSTASHDSAVPTPWDITYPQQLGYGNDYPGSHQLKQKPHIVFV